MLLNPFAFYWNLGEFNAKLTEFVVAPTGHYDVNALINVGRNYWAVDDCRDTSSFRSHW